MLRYVHMVTCLYTWCEGVHVVCGDGVIRDLVVMEDRVHTIIKYRYV